MSRPNEFTDLTKRAAVARQRGRCAFCGALITTPWTRGLVPGDAHHLKPVIHGGNADVENCVYLCYGDHKLMGHGMASYGIDRQGGSSRTMVMLSKRDFRYWNG